MRISDWSSDVCSSDLRKSGMDFLDLNSSMASASSVWMRFMTHLPSSFFVAHQRATGPEHRYGAPKGPAALAVYHPPPFVSARQRFSRDPPIATLQGSHALPTSGAAGHADKIGRASGRERVGQYV